LLTIASTFLMHHSSIHVMERMNAYIKSFFVQPSNEQTQTPVMATSEPIFTPAQIEAMKTAEKEELHNLAVALQQSHISYEQEQQKRIQEQIEKEKQQKADESLLIQKLGKLIPLPSSLQNKRIYHLQARAQKGGTSCGYNTIINAEVIENITKATQVPNAETIQKATQELLSKIPEFLEQEMSLPMLETIGTFSETNDPEQEKRNAVHFATLRKLLDNTYFITYSPDTIIQPAGTSVNTPLGDLDNALAQIKNVPTVTLHFPTLIGSEESGHWVYIGVIKEANQLPYIILLDSCNSKVQTGSSLEKILNELYRRIS
jgi:hypothetical protein